MAPTPRIQLNKPLESGQTTILNTLNRGLALQRPPPAPRSGLIPKLSSQSNTVLGRRIIGGANKKQVAQLFALVSLSQYKNREPRDFNIINNTGVANDLEDPEFKYILTKQYLFRNITLPCGGSGFCRGMYATTPFLIRQGRLRYT
jgi:hypothetical protein